MKYYESRIRTVLNVLKDACRTEYLEAEQIRYRSCGYEMDSVMKEEISGWKIFEKGDTWGCLLYTSNFNGASLKNDR